ncbi:MAG: MMPL family transporter, partial [Chitinophagales bacterium]
MQRTFLFIYESIKSQKAFAAIVLLLFLFAIGWMSSQLEFKEDINKIIPNDDELEKVNLVFENSRFMDKMVLTIYAKDSSKSDQDQLLKAGDYLVGQMDSLFRPNYIREINYELPQDVYNQLYDEFYANLPLFINDADYAEILKKTDSAALKETVAANYKALLSPAGFAMKKNILKDPLNLTGLAFDKLSELEFGENYNIYQNRIFSRDGKHLMIFMETANPSNETGENGAFLDALDTLITDLHNDFPGLKAEYFGGAAVAVSNARQIKQDAILTASFAALVLVFFISFFYRRKRIFALIFLPVLLGGLTALSVLYLIKGEVSAIALGVGSVLLGISIDYSLHIFTHLRKVNNRRKLIRDLSFPILISSITTASAFFCLLLVRSEALHDLGLFAGISVLSAAIFALIILPQLAPDLKREEKKRFSPVGIIEKLSILQLDKSKWILALVLLLSILFYFSSKKIGFESDLNNMNYVRPELQQTEDRLNRINDYKLKSVFVLAEGATLEKALQHNEKVQQDIRQLQEKDIVQKYTNPGSFMISDSLQSVRIQKWQNFWAENGRGDSVLQQMQRYGDDFKLKAKALDGLRQQIKGDYQAKGPAAYTKLQELFLDGFVSENQGQSTVINVLKVENEDKEAVYAALEPLEHIFILDKQYLTGRFMEVLKKDFDVLVKYSLLVVFIILLLAYGRIELTLFTLIPVALAWLWTTGIMGLFGMQFNIFNIIISTFVLGLGIDYSIFLMRGLLQEYHKGKRMLESYKTSIILSAFTTLTGIGVLIFAKHPALQSIALMSIIGISSVLFISFSITPLIFRFFVQSRKERGLPPYTLIRWFSTLYTYGYFVVGCLFISFCILILFFVPISKKIKKRFIHKLIQLGTKTLVYGTVIVKTRVQGLENVNWDKPKVIIANHQSFLDILVILMQNPKIIMLTNDWVYNSPFFGFLVRYADFYPVASGYQSSVQHLKDVVNDGYSIAVYPEGTRSPDGQLKRFHKGAFLLAEKLNIPIQPLMIHGSGDVTRKHDFMTDFGQMTLRFLPEISLEDAKFGTDYRERTKIIGKHFKSAYEAMSNEIETPYYFRHKLQSAYLYKSPILEWYSKIKIRLQDYYVQYDQICPEEGKIVDLGCGYGYLPYMLMLTGRKRQV